MSEHSQALRIAPGRRLRWSPEWRDEEATVLFDGASGDFWVLDRDARALLQQVESEPGLTVAAVLTDSPWDASHLNELLSRLVNVGLLATLSDVTSLAPP